MDRTAAFYSRPSYVSGAGAIFSGARRQRGGSVLGAIKSIVTPILGLNGKLGSSLKRNALGFVKDVATDVIKGRNVKNSLLTRGKERGLKTLKQTFYSAPEANKRKRRQRGSGKKRASSKRPSRKRRASRKRTPKAKRRRHNF